MECLKKNLFISLYVYGFFFLEKKKIFVFFSVFIQIHLVFECEHNIQEEEDAVDNSKSTLSQS